MNQYLQIQLSGTHRRVPRPSGRKRLCSNKVKTCGFNDSAKRNPEFNGTSFLLINIIYIYIMYNNVII